MVEQRPNPKTAREVIAETLAGIGEMDYSEEILAKIDAAGFVIVPRADVEALKIYEAAIKLIDEREHGPAVLVSHKAVQDVERVRKAAQEPKP